MRENPPALVICMVDVFAVLLKKAGETTQLVTFASRVSSLCVIPTRSSCVTQFLSLVFAEWTDHMPRVLLGRGREAG